MKEIRYRIDRREGGTDRLISKVTNRIDALAGAVHREEDSCLQFWRVHGSPSEINAFKTIWTADPHPPLRGSLVLEERPRFLLLVAQWDRPEIGGPLTAEDILAALVWSPILTRIRMHRHQIDVQAIGESGPCLLRSFTRLKKECAPQLRLQLVRIGEVRPQNTFEEQEFGLDQADARLLDLALSRGYYDIPRRCGVRELAEELGICKSLISKRLRVLERETLQRFRDETRSPLVEDVFAPDGPVHTTFT